MFIRIKTNVHVYCNSKVLFTTTQPIIENFVHVILEWLKIMHAYGGIL